METKPTRDGERELKSDRRAHKDSLSFCWFDAGSEAVRWRGRLWEKSSL